MTTIEHVIAIVADIARHDTVTASTSLDTLGLDSLSCIEIVVAVEDAFDVSIHCAERISFETPACIAHLVDAQIRARLPLAA